MEDQYYDIERRTAIKEEVRMFRRKFIIYEQAEIIYSISHRKLKDMVGKSNDSVNLAAALIKLEQKVLVVDADPQGSCTISFFRNKLIYHWSRYSLYFLIIIPTKTLR